MNRAWRQATFLRNEPPPQANSGGVLWNLDDPALPASLEKGRREPGKVNRALRAYLLLGQARSLAALQTGLAAQNRLVSLRQLRAWCKSYAWDERARHYDELCSQREGQERAERRWRVLQEGLSTSLERVDELKERYAALKKDLLREERVWLVEVKYQRMEDGHFERVENLRFNAALIAQARGLLADLARETGGRVLRSELSAAPTGQDANPARPSLDFSGLSKDELDILEKVMNNMGLDDELYP